jgi:dephospho-CoA kinase
LPDGPYLVDCYQQAVTVKTIGVIGGIASGKSLVSRMLGELGAQALDADRVGHAVLAENDEVKRALLERWGPGVLSPDGSINRQAVAQRVFAPGDAGRSELDFLEGLMHPRISERLQAERDRLLREGNGPVVIEPSMLLESDRKLAFDVLVFVDAPRQLRLSRAIQRGWTAEQFAAREAAQWPVEEKRRRADVVIPNEGSEVELRRAVQAFWDKYVG